MANAVEMSTMRKLVAQLNRYRHEYYNLNAPSVADDVYDYMYDELLALEEHTGVCMANSPTQTVGYPVVSALPKVAHDIPLLSLDKTKSIEDLIAFQAGRTVDLSLKLDGLTTELIYENGQLIRLSTRGDGYIGENITHNAKAISGIPERIPYRNALNGGQPVCGLHDGCDRKGRALYPQRHQREDRIVGCCGRQFCNKKDRLSDLW